MFDLYPFIIPIFIIWVFVFLIPIIMVFHTKLGIRGYKFFNRTTFMKFVNMTVLLFFLIILGSGLWQLTGEYKLIFGKSDNYWHAMGGFIFLLVSLNHVIIYFKSVYRYFFKPKTVVEGKEVE